MGQPSFSGVSVSQVSAEQCRVLPFTLPFNSNFRFTASVHLEQTESPYLPSLFDIFLLNILRMFPAVTTVE